MCKLNSCLWSLPIERINVEHTLLLGTHFLPVEIHVQTMHLITRGYNTTWCPHCQHMTIELKAWSKLWRPMRLQLHYEGKFSTWALVDHSNYSSVVSTVPAAILVQYKKKLWTFPESYMYTANNHPVIDGIKGGQWKGAYNSIINVNFYY